MFARRTELSVTPLSSESISSEGSAKWFMIYFFLLPAPAAAPAPPRVAACQSCSTSSCAVFTGSLLVFPRVLLFSSVYSLLLFQHHLQHFFIYFLNIKYILFLLIQLIFKFISHFLNVKRKNPFSKNLLLHIILLNLFY